MNDYRKESVAIVRAQASVRVMSEEELMVMVKKLIAGLENVSAFAPDVGEFYEVENAFSDPCKSTKEKAITFLECGKNFKILTQASCQPRP